MGQFNLEFAFPRMCAPSEDLEDEARTIEYLALPVAFEIALLDGRELGVDAELMAALVEAAIVPAEAQARARVRREADAVTDLAARGAVAGDSSRPPCPPKGCLRGPR